MGSVQQYLTPDLFPSFFFLDSGPTHSGAATALMTSWTDQAIPRGP